MGRDLTLLLAGWLAGLFTVALGIVLGARLTARGVPGPTRSSRVPGFEGGQPTPATRGRPIRTSPEDRAAERAYQAVVERGAAELQSLDGSLTWEAAKAQAVAALRETGVFDWTGGAPRG